jgi:hypothetical protein
MEFNCYRINVHCTVILGFLCMVLLLRRDGKHSVLVADAAGGRQVLPVPCTFGPVPSTNDADLMAGKSCRWDRPAPVRADVRSMGQKILFPAQMLMLLVFMFQNGQHDTLTCASQENLHRLKYKCR